MDVIIPNHHRDLDTLNGFAADHHDLFVAFLNAERLIGTATKPVSRVDCQDERFRSHRGGEILSIGMGRLSAAKITLPIDVVILQSPDRLRHWRIVRTLPLPFDSAETKAKREEVDAVIDHFDGHERIAGLIVNMTDSDVMALFLLMADVLDEALPGPATVTAIRFH